jgi:DHA3 family tetracycline resistance protein-like MFS transporter
VTEPPRRVAIARPFASRDFRLLWTGMSVSLLGDGFFLVSIAWQAYELSDSPTALGLVGLAWTLPMVALLLLGGVVSDRFDRRRVMIVSDVVRGAAVTGIGVLALTGRLELWHLYALTAVYGAGDALFAPAFGAIVPQIVPREHLIQANAVDQVVRPLALQLGGPATGGLLVDAAGAGGAFLADAGTFAVSITALTLMRARPRDRAAAAAASVVAEIRAGLRVARSHTWLWGTLLAAALFLLVWLGPFEVLLPYVVKNELGGSARDLGFVLASAGAGAIVAALFMAQRDLPKRTITFMYGAFALSVSGPITYGLAGELWPMVVAAFAAGLGMGSGNVVWVTLMQRHVPNELLGRVTSLDWFVSVSLTPISFALAGPVAGALGVRETLAGAGVLGVAITVAFLFFPGMRDLERARPASA